MAAPTKKIFTVGLNAARIYELDADGYIDGTETAYDGTAVGGPVVFTYEPPDPESIVHPGNNTVLQRDVLPSQETASGTLEVSRTDYDTIALLNNVNVNVIGEANSVLWGSNQAGTEPTVGLVVYAQGKGPSGNRTWSTYVIPKCTIIPKPKGMAREQANIKYFVQPQAATAHLTGMAFTINDDGATAGEVVEYQSNYRMHFTSWNKTTSSATFTLGTSYPMVSTAGLTVYKDGVKQTTGYTATTGAITFTSNVTEGTNVAAMYELAESASDLE